MPRGFPVTSRGSPVDPPWIPRGSSVGLPWVSRGSPVDFPWIPRGAFTNTFTNTAGGAFGNRAR
eukprot:8072046-Alexandrium_andersonii.AAC.1